MLEQIILGIIQGIAEWLPISSEGVIVLVVKNFWGGEKGIEEIIKTALFLHLGTFLAALFYFRKDVWGLINLGVQLLKIRSWTPKETPQEEETKKIFKFLIIATLISGFLGFVLIKILTGLEEQFFLSTKLITLIVGLLLLITGGLQVRASSQGNKKAKDLTPKDGFLLGLIQGLAVLPGLSRSGLTVSTLLLRRFNSSDALRLSFLMSLPIVLGGNIILNWRDLAFSNETIWGLVFSFIFGLLTINLLLRLARKINFGYFVLIFGLVVIVSVFI
jgi:undecaprenyl-diphosphatase